MKSLEINGKEYPMSFGLDFIREMDKRYTVDAQGFPLGAGLQSALIYLVQENPTVLEDIILSATHTLRSVPSHKDIESWIEEKYEDDSIDGVYKDFLSAFENAPLTKKKTKEMLEAMETQENPKEA